MSARLHRPGRAERGFTLLEVMAALAIFLIGIMSVLALLSAGTRMHSDSQRLGVTNDAADEVLLLAEREVAERAPLASRDANATGLPEAPPWKPVPGRVGLSYRWDVRAAALSGLYLLTVELSWLEGGKTRTFAIERVLPRLESPTVDAARLLNRGT